MSHFTVLVIGPEPEKQLQPYHEFECTGTDDEYVQDIDITEEVKQEYEKDTSTRLKAPDGSLHEPWSDQFYRDPLPGENVGMGMGCGNGISWNSKDWGDGKGYRAKVQFIPEGWQGIEVPRSHIETFAEYVEGYYGKTVVPFGADMDLEDEHKYGYALTDADGQITKIIKRTNPNDKWDWYQLGGRWSGLLKLKPVKQLGCATVHDTFEGFTVAEMDQFVAMRKESPTKFEKLMAKYNGKGELIRKKVQELVDAEGKECYPDHKVGRPGLMTDPATPGYCDAAEKRYIDFAGMRDEAGKKAAKQYDDIAKKVDLTTPHETWPSIRDRTEGIDNARAAYGNQPLMLAFKTAKESDPAFGKAYWWAELDDFVIPREEYIQNARNAAGVTFAVIKGGVWYEKGSMGWWGAVSGKKDQNKWNKEFADLIDSVPDDTLLSVYDCHI